MPPWAADQLPGRTPPYCVCSGGADTVTRGGPKPLRFGPLSASPVASLRPVSPSRCVGCGDGSSATPGFGAVVLQGGRLLAAPGRGACVRVPSTPGWGSPPVVAGGPSPTLAEVLGVVPRHSWPESAAGAGGVALCHSWLRSAGLWGVVVAGGPLPLQKIGGSGAHGRPQAPNQQHSTTTYHTAQHQHHTAPKNTAKRHEPQKTAHNRTRHHTTRHERQQNTSGRRGGGHSQSTQRTQHTRPHTEEEWGGRR